MSGQRGIAMIVSGFPRRSETFALNELLALESQGLLTALFATKLGDGSPLQPGSERLMQRVQYLPSGTPVEQAEAIVTSLSGAAAQGCVAGVHGYFAHLPAELAALVASRLGVPYGFSMHARDARKITAEVLADRARSAAGVIVCNEDVAHEVPAGDARVHVVPHGVDLERFHAAPVARGRAAKAAHPTLRILAVGRLVPKKGFDVLIDAVARLDLPFEVSIIGDGPERERLIARIATHGLAEQVRLIPGMTHAELPAVYAAADVVAVPSVVDASGDRDGLPNVVLEAMAVARPIVAANAGAMSSAIHADETGILVPSADSLALASALQRLAGDPDLRRRLGQTARCYVEHEYSLAQCTERFQQVIRRMYGC